MNIKDATYKWVNEFNAIPQALIEKAYGEYIEEITELTPISLNDTVYIHSGKYAGENGEVIKINNESNIAYVEINGQNHKISLDDLEVERYSQLPMWGTVWTFGNAFDNRWLDSEENRQAMANCGFRIYESNELDYFFGIDGAGYDFYDAHWIPLYKARGLQWHDKKDE